MAIPGTPSQNLKSVEESVKQHMRPAAGGLAPVAQWLLQSLMNMYFSVNAFEGYNKAKSKAGTVTMGPEQMKNLKDAGDLKSDLNNLTNIVHESTNNLGLGNAVPPSSTVPSAAEPAAPAGPQVSRFTP